MGLLRIAAVGALGYFAYRALQNRSGPALFPHDEVDDVDTHAQDDTPTADAPHVSDGAPRPS